MDRSSDDLESQSPSPPGSRDRVPDVSAEEQHVNQSEAETRPVSMDTTESSQQPHSDQPDSKLISDSKSKSDVETNQPEQKTSRSHPPPLVRNMSTQVLDFSDPLQNYQKSKDESIFERKGSLHEITHNVSKR